MTDPLTEAKIAESANATAVAKEAEHNAYQAQLHDSIVKAFREVFRDGSDDAAPILIKRVPFICEDIRTIKLKINLIFYLGGGILAGIGLLALKQLGV